MTPADPQPPAPGPAAPEPGLQRGKPYPWSRKLLAVLFATFCLEIGFFLLLFPWTPYADDFGFFRPEWRAYWDNHFVRGAISGLGVVNLYVSFVEIAGLRRFAKR
jgi:hypothetical protein